MSTAPRTQLGGGSVTSGSHATANAQQSFGRDWNSGSALLSLGIFRIKHRSCGERPRLSVRRLEPTRCFRDSIDRKNAFLNIGQDITSGFRGFANALYSLDSNHDNSVDDLLKTGFCSRYLHTHNATLFSTLGTDVSLPRDVNLEIATVFSSALESLTGIYRSPNYTNQRSTDVDVSAKFDGNIVSLPAGAAKFALGGGYTSERLRSTLVLSPTEFQASILGRHTNYAFGELYVPIVGAGQQIPGMERLELTGAARYTDYSDFGGNTSPKVSLLYSPISSLKLRGSYSESFRAPFLAQLDPNGVDWELLPISFYPTVGSYFGLPANGNILYAGGSNPNLGPETSHMKSAGFDFYPDFYKPVSLSATYYEINYRQRIVSPPAVLALDNPGTYSFLFNTHPTLAEVASIIPYENDYLGVSDVNPTSAASVFAATSVIEDARTRNIAITQMSGLDLTFEGYSNDGLDLGSQVSKIFHYRSQASPAVPYVENVNMVTDPVVFRDISWAGFTFGTLSSQLGLNYWGIYGNQFDPSNSHVSSWTTFEAFQADTSLATLAVLPMASNFC